MNERHIIDSDRYTDRCGNCGTYLPIGAKYCIKCGTRRGDGLFEPLSNTCDTLYGSPRLFKMQCSAYIKIPTILVGVFCLQKTYYISE